MENKNITPKVIILALITLTVMFSTLFIFLYYMNAPLIFGLKAQFVKGSLCLLTSFLYYIYYNIYLDEHGNKSKWNLYSSIGWFITVLLIIF